VGPRERTPPELTGETPVEVPLADWVRDLVKRTAKEVACEAVQAQASHCGIRRLWRRVDFLTLGLVVVGLLGGGDLAVRLIELLK